MMKPPKRRHYEPRQIIAPTTPADRKLHRENENLLGLLQACQGLIEDWDHGGAIDPSEIDRNIEHIREALGALGWLKEDF